MGFLFELIVQEFIIQILFELGFHSVLEVFNRKPNPKLAFIGYIILGAISGGVSVVFFSYRLLKNPIAATSNLLVTPILAGLVMATIGKLRERKGISIIRLDRFSYGAAFAFAMAIVRYFWAS